MTQLRHSPLHDTHVALGATFTPFGEWDMPLKYGSELDEHRAVRTAAGLFDLSHMGEVRVTGERAAEFLDYALISKLSALAVGRAKYSMMVNEAGGILDDLITYRLAEDEFLVIPNAGNTPKIVAALTERVASFEGVTVTNESADTALIALQGPAAERLLLAELSDAAQREAIQKLRYYAWTRIDIAGLSNVLIARTGYTGEDGFELYVPNEAAPGLWDLLVAPEEVLPCGLAARDSLRLEAAMPLYGNELSEELTPVDAGLGVLIAAKKEGDFVGREALLAAKETTPTRVLAGLTSSGRRAARAGAKLLDAEGTEVGVVTSGQPSPTLGYPIALAYLDSALATPGQELNVDIRGKQYPFAVVELPFYRREA